MSKSVQIMELFAELSAIDQQKLLRTLSQHTGCADAIAQFSHKHQKQFRDNVIFRVETAGRPDRPVVTVTVKTFYGEYKGTGINQKIAKAEAVANADKEWPVSISN